MAFFALFMGFFHCKSKSMSRTGGNKEANKEASADDSGAPDAQKRLLRLNSWAQEKSYIDMLKIHKKPVVVCIQTEIHERIRKHKPKNSLLCCICMQKFFRLFLLSIFPKKSYSGKSFCWLSISQYHQPLWLTGLQNLIISHPIKRGGTALECKRGIVR